MIPLYQQLHSHTYSPVNSFKCNNRTDNNVHLYYSLFFIAKCVYGRLQAGAQFMHHPDISMTIIAIKAPTTVLYIKRVMLRVGIDTSRAAEHTCYHCVNISYDEFHI